MSRFTVGRYGRSTLYTTGSLIARAIIQAGCLVMLSRWLGPDAFGLFAGTVAAAALVAPLSGWGIAYVISQRLSRDRAVLRALWASALVQILSGGTVLSCFMVAVAGAVFAESMSTQAILLIVLSELIAVPIAQTIAGICHAIDRSRSSALIVCLIPASRLLFVVMALLTGMPGEPDAIAALHCLGAIVGTVAAVGIFGVRPAFKERLSLRDSTRTGARYAMGSAVNLGYQEVDKVLLLQLVGATVTGTYTTSFRVVSVLSLPILAMMSTALPRLFASHGTQQGDTLLKAIVAAVAAYSVLAVGAGLLIAPWMPAIFGDGFADSATYLLMLAPWILPYALHQVAATGLTAAGRQFQRVKIEVAGLTIVVVSNLLLLPSIGASGAIVSLLLAETCMAIGCALLLMRSRR